MLLSSSPSSAQSLEWAKQAGGTSIDRGNGIAVDTSGNSYVTGSFRASATFGAGELNETTLVSAGSADIFVAKYDGNGDLVWAKQAGGTFFEIGLGIAVDTSGNSYVTGRFGPSATFGAGEANETTLVRSAAGNTDIFVAKYDGNGDLVWAKQAGGTGFTFGNGIAVDTSGNSYLTGRFGPSATFGAGEANETTLVNVSFSGNGDMFVAKYDGNGDLVWAKQAGGTFNDGGHGIAVDTSGNSYVTGEFSLSTTFGAGELNETTLVSAGRDIFVAKYDGKGDLVWAKQAGGAFGFGIAVDTSGNSYVTGSFSFSATFGAGELNEITLVGASSSEGSSDIFIAKYDGNGDLVWAKQAGGEATDRGRGIAVDTSGNSYVTGSFRDLGAGTTIATFGAGEANETTLVSAGASDIFVAKYDGNGDLVWAIQAGGIRGEFGHGIAVDTSGNSYVTGIFSVRSLATFGAGELNETTLVSAGSNDIFVAKFSVDTDGDGVPDSVDACPGTPSGEVVDASGCAPVQSLPNLIDDVQSLNLNTGIENSLVAILDAAQRVLQDGNTNDDVTACFLLQVFFNVVDTWAGKHISQDDADALSAAAQEILVVLDCSPQPICGDGTVDPNEECDDGNNIDGDGCSANCTIEERCDDGSVPPCAG